MDRMPVYLRKPVFEKLFDVAEYSKLNKEEKEMYDIELKRKWDRANILAFAKAEGIAEGEAKGRAEGEAKGKAEVIVMGWKNGFTIEQLQALTGWEKDRINEVLKRNRL
jgi:predicted transposase/invertase (TIGR01784 family)